MPIPRHAKKAFYTLEDKLLILNSWWNPELRDEVVSKLGKSYHAIEQQYLNTLYKLGIDWKVYTTARSFGENPLEKIVNLEERLMTHTPYAVTTKKENNAVIKPRHKRTPKTTPETYKPTPPAPQVDPEETQVLDDDPPHERTSITDDKITTFLENMLAMWISGKSLIRFSVLMDENNKLKAENLKLRMENDKAAKALENLNFWLGEFMGLQSVEKIASLEDFVQKLQYTVDTYGEVVSVQKKGKRIQFMEGVKD